MLSPEVETMMATLVSVTIQEVFLMVFVTIGDIGPNSGCTYFWGLHTCDVFFEETKIHLSSGIID